MTSFEQIKPKIIRSICCHKFDSSHENYSCFNCGDRQNFHLFEGKVSVNVCKNCFKISVLSYFEGNNLEEQFPVKDCEQIKYTSYIKKWIFPHELMGRSSCDLCDNDKHYQIEKIYFHEDNDNVFWFCEEHFLEIIMTNPYIDSVASRRKDRIFNE